MRLVHGLFSSQLDATIQIITMNTSETPHSRQKPGLEVRGPVSLSNMMFNLNAIVIL